MEEVDFNEFILANMPYFIAVNYQRLLEAQKPQEQVRLILHIYNLGLRVLTINLVSQYLFRDRDQVSDPHLNKLLEQKFPHLTPDAWEEILFTILSAYEDNRDLFFMPELYDFYWDTSTYPHRRRAELKQPFDRLTQATQDIQMERQLQDESTWKALAEELRGHLRNVLQRLYFIGKYDLIHVLSQDKHAYTFDLHKGTQILVSQQRPLPEHASLTTGWFYLRSAGDDFFSLHPLLVFWEDTNELVDTAVFDRWIQRRLKYLLATPDQTRFDEKHFKEFIYLILDAIEEAGHRHKGEAEKLTWMQLRDTCKKISTEQMTTVQGKYHQNIFLQRNTVRQHVEAFLADPKKRGFVLVGKSGVGKSNFLLALAEELQQARDDVCVLMYDGASLPVASSPLTDIISQDFSNYVFLSGKPLQQVWQEIARIERIDERQVILCVDAVNENPEAAKLLRQLDELVKKESVWPWLKIMLSSRPETWKEIKRGLKLAEGQYYREPSAETLGVELEPFTYSERMDPFTPQELPEVYSKYREEFHLQTPYRDLSHQVREILRDPLQLRLLAKTYRQKAIPEHVTVSTLIEQYVKAVLQREERRFLEQQLVPLMVREGHYSNVITEDELDAAGGALYEMIYSDQVLSNGQRMNQAFLTLSDADILALQDQGTEQRIRFKYERFYEYFAGKRIGSLSLTQPDRYAYFLGLFEEMTGKKETSGKPFLWGAIRNALVEEAKKPNSETILRLCRTTEQQIKEMMVNVLITLGLDDSRQIEGILRNLVPQEKQADEVQKIRQVVRKPTEEADLRTRNARKIAIEVASHLKLSWVLQSAALQPDPTTRAMAVRYSYYLWQRDQTVGFAVLEYFAQQATAGLIPNFAAFESVVGLSLIIFCDHYQEKAVLSTLQGIWREMIAKLFHVREGHNPMRDFIRERIISFVITIVFSLFGQLPAYNMLSYQALDAFFHLGAAEKELYRQLVHYFDVNGDYTREKMEQDYLAVLKIDNVLVSLTTLIGLVAHACSAPQAFLPFLKQLFEAAKSDVASYPYLTIINNVTMDVLELDPKNDEMFDFFVYTTEVCRECYTRHPERYHNRNAEAPQVLATAPYIVFQYRRTGTVRTTLLEAPIQAALSQHNLTYFDIMLTSELPQVGIEKQEPRAALAALEVFFKSGDDEINHKIQRFLSRLHIYYPHEVEDFLEEQQAPEEFRLQIRTNEPVEKVGDLIAKRPWVFARDGVLLGPPALRTQLMSLFEKAADSKNIKAWMDYNIRLLVNLIYGDQVLRQSK